ncbi:MAG: hypothetical protein EOM54_09700 [Clostridia bacterium]|nr:hypothetical protein [Clostridia bacterium]
MRKPGKYSKKGIIFLAAVMALTILSGACLTAFLVIGNTLESQKAAERFRGDGEMRFAQVSAFFPVGEGKSLTNIYTLRQSVESALLEASLEAPAGGSLWIDAYSASADITVTGTRGSASVSTLGVGGEWFFFHPLRLRSGSYLSEDDLMHDKVVLDEELAWKLFGGVDLEGLEVTINDKPYIIAGVVSREDDFASEKAYSGSAGMFMYYDALNAISQTDIENYELCCADPISGFALSVLETGFPGAVTLQNTGRFSISSSFGRIAEFGERAISSEGVAFPYWENAARYAEDYAALILALFVLFGLFPLGCLAVLIVRFIKRVKSKLSFVIPSKWEKFSDNIRERQRLKLEKKEKSI